MQEYNYADNGKEIVEWVPCGLGCGKSLADNLAEAKSKGLTWDADKLPETPDTAITLEDWIAQNGFGGIRLPALMDLEGKLKVAGKTGTKLTETRAWLDANMARYAAGQTSATAEVWGLPPFAFEIVAADAMAALTA